MSELERFIESWRIASRELEIEVIFDYLYPYNNRSYILLVKHFGRKNGTLVSGIMEHGLINPDDHDFFHSCMNLSAYGYYDRDQFIETLSDWGYYGKPEYKPDWYKGYICPES